MNEEKMKEMEGRLEKLEKANKGVLRFFVQYIISPLLILLMGSLFNYQLQKQSSQLQKIEIAHSMLDTLFSGDYSKSLATARLMDKLLNDPQLVEEINNILKDLMLKKVTEALASRDYGTVYEIYSAADEMTSDSEIKASITKNAEVVQRATDYKNTLDISNQMINAIDEENYDHVRELSNQLEEKSPDLYQELGLRNIPPEELSGNQITRDVREKLSSKLETRQLSIKP